MDNRFETVLHNLARNEHIVSDFDFSYLEFRPRHNSPGGTVVRQMGNDFKCLFDQSFDPSIIFDWIFQNLGFEILSKNNKLNEFFGMLHNFSIENLYSKVKLPSTTSNFAILQIMCIHSIEHSPKEWNS